MTYRCTGYILTHYHGDHYRGLHSKNWNQHGVLIHCTPITGALLVYLSYHPYYLSNSNYKPPFISKFLHLSLTFMLFSTIQVNIHGIHADLVHVHKFREPFDLPGCTVTFLNANHCPGAAMVLFDVMISGRTHLHCGDMRFCKQMLQEPSLLSSEIDCLYLVSEFSNTAIYWIFTAPNLTRIIRRI